MAARKATKKSPEKTTRSSAKKTTGSPAKKTTGQSTGKSAEKSTQKSARKSTRKQAQGRSGDAPRTEAPRRPRATQIAARAAQELLELTGRDVEGVTGLERVDDGWSVQVEVVEVHRIPDTTDVLALYEVETDANGSLQGYRRLRRYARGTPGEE